MLEQKAAILNAFLDLEDGIQIACMDDGLDWIYIRVPTITF